MKKIRIKKIRIKENIQRKKHTSFHQGISPKFKASYRKSNETRNLRKHFNSFIKNKKQNFNFKKNLKFKNKTLGNFKNSKGRKITFRKRKYRSEIKNKTFKEKFNPFRTYRKYHTRNLNWRARRKGKKSAKFSLKASRKRYKFYKFYRRANMFAYSQLNRTFKNIDENNAGIESTEKLLDKRLATHTRKYFKNKNKPKKFLHKAAKFEKKGEKLKKKSAFKKDLQKLSRKKKYKDSKITSKFIQRRNIKRKHLYTIDKKIENVLKRFWGYIKTIPSRIFTFIKGKIVNLIWLALSSFLFITIIVLLTSALMFFQNTTTDIVATTTYLSDIEVLKKMENYYRDKEKRLLDEIYNPQKYYINYDIYEVDADDVGHDVHDLLSYVTARYGEIKDFDKFKNSLDELFERNYKKSITKSIVDRYIDEEGTAYKKKQKKIVIHLRRKEIKDIAKNDFSEDKENLEHFETLLETKGNMEDELKEFENPIIYGDRKIYKPAKGYQKAMEKYINSPLVTPGSIRQAVLMWCATHEGIPYRLGAGHGVPIGKYGNYLDCSSFVCNAWGQCGGNIDRVYATFNMPNRFVKSIPKSSLKPGDAILNQQHHIEIFLGFENGYRTTGSHQEGVPSGMSFWGQNITHFITLSNLDSPADPALLKQLEDEIKKYDPKFERRK